MMRSCSMALCLLSTAMGSYLAGALTWVVQVASERASGQAWLPNDLNKARLGGLGHRGHGRTNCAGAGRVCAACPAHVPLCVFAPCQMSSGWLQGRIDLFFFLLAGLMASNLVAFMVVAMRYQYKQASGQPAALVDTSLLPASPAAGRHDLGAEQPLQHLCARRWSIQEGRAWRLLTAPFMRTMR